VAENFVIGEDSDSVSHEDCFEFLDEPSDRVMFRSYCKHLLVAKDELLCSEGEFSDAIYFVESGGFDIIVQNIGTTERRLAKISTGAMVGEMAFYTGEARAASIRATEESLVHILSTNDLNRMRVSTPELATRFDHMVIRKVSRSLTRANRLISTLG
jgi:CRP-like cAMP-binding protein